MMDILDAWQWSYDGWIIIVTSLVAVICVIPGSFLLVRREAMLGDAIAHAVLPGIAIGFFVSGDRGGGWMLSGAIIAGLVTAMATQLLKGVAGVDRGAALGVVYSTLFALGLVLVVRISDSVDLDPACVLYGQVELVPLDLIELGGVKVPRVVPWLLGVLVAMIVIMGVLWKEFLVTSFDSAVAESQGIPAAMVNQILMILVAAACVVAFEAVGSILVVSLLITPAAIARLGTDRFGHILVASAFVGVFFSALGHIAAIGALGLFFGHSVAVSTAGMTAVLLAVALGVAAAIAAALSRTSIIRR
jgi:manganese/zinc/iron transport system permease protein